MDLVTARAVLGIGVDTDLAAARQAYRDRARLLHPDRADDSLVASATRAMAQLNAAWDVVRAAAAHPSAVAAPRCCTACSFQPASVVRSTGGAGALVFDRASRPVCTCGGAAEHRRTTGAPTPVRV